MTEQHEEVKVGTNRTGIALARERTESMIEGSEELLAQGPADPSAISATRIEYTREAEPIGTMPPPTSFKGLAKTAMKSISGGQPTLFMDKLGERLAFERTGVRLYEGLIAKVDALGTFAGGPTREELERVMEEEREHFQEVLIAIESLSGDPTAVTPSADLSAVCAHGVGEVIADPRTSLLQCLEAIVVAEATDNEGWEVLVELADIAEEAALRETFAQARADEREHLRLVRAWIAAGQGRAREEEPVGASVMPPPSRKKRAAKKAKKSRRKAPAKKKTSRKKRVH
jgi:rubrerythrin